MCGGAIISDILPPSRSSHRLTVTPTCCGEEGPRILMRTSARESITPSHELRSWSVVDFDHDLEDVFKDYSESDHHEEGFNVRKKSASKCKTFPVLKKKEEESVRRIRQRPWGKWDAEIRDKIQGKGLEFGSELLTLLTAEEAAKAYDTEAQRIRGKKAKLNFPEDAPASASSAVKL